jgi:hypothetical protein
MTHPDLREVRILTVGKWTVLEMTMHNGVKNREILAKVVFP